VITFNIKEECKITRTTNGQALEEVADFSIQIPGVKY